MAESTMLEARMNHLHLLPNGTLDAKTGGSAKRWMALVSSVRYSWPAPTPMAQTGQRDVQRRGWFADYRWASRPPPQLPLALDKGERLAIGSLIMGGSCRTVLPLEPSTRLNALAHPVCGGANSEQRKNVPRYIRKLTFTDNNEEKAQRNHKSEDEELKSGHAGTAAIFRNQLAYINLAARNSRKDEKTKKEKKDQHAVRDGKLYLFHRVMVGGRHEDGDEKGGNHRQDHADHELDIPHVSS